MKNIFSIIIILCLISLAAVGIAYRYAENNDFYFSQINQQIENRTGLTLAKTGALELCERGERGGRTSLTSCFKCNNTS